MKKQKVDAIKEQVFTTGEIIEKEAIDLDYVISKIQTNVDFISAEAEQTIEKWKTAEMHRQSSLDDLKYKFRLDTYSIEDGLNLLYSYPRWIAKQRRKLAVFVRFLGTEQQESKNLIVAIDRVERAEWEKDLEMDMEVLYTLGQIREIYQITVEMASRLKDLDVAIKKRSNQVMRPTWEPRGLL